MARGLACAQSGRGSSRVATVSSAGRGRPMWIEARHGVSDPRECAAKRDAGPVRRPSPSGAAGRYHEEDHGMRGRARSGDQRSLPARSQRRRARRVSAIKARRGAAATTRRSSARELLGEKAYERRGWRALEEGHEGIGTALGAAREVGEEDAIEHLGAGRARGRRRRNGLTGKGVGEGGRVALDSRGRHSPSTACRDRRRGRCDRCAVRPGPVAARWSWG